MKKRFIFFVWSLLGFIFFAKTIWADVIHLKSGKAVTGKIMEKRDDSVKIETFGVQLTYYSDEIDRIEEVPLKTAQMEKAQGQDGKEKETSGSSPTEDASDIEEQKEITSESSPAASLATPQEAYQAYLNALEGEDWQVIKKYVSRENIAAMEAGGNVAEAMIMLKDLRVKDLEIIDTIMTDDRATLVAYGTTLFGRAEGIVEMVMEDGEWKVNKTSWEGEEKTQNSPLVAPAMPAQEKERESTPVTPPADVPKEDPSSQQ